MPDPWSGVVIQPGQTVQIAVVGPVNDILPELFSGMLDAAKMASEDYGPLHGFDVELMVYNDQCAGFQESDGRSIAEAVAREVVDNDQIVGIIGPVCSKATIAGLPTYETAHVVAISGSATDPTIISYGPTIFNRTILNDDQIKTAGFESDAYINALGSVQNFYSDFGARTGSDLPMDLRHFVAYVYDATIILLRAVDQVSIVRPDGVLIVGRQSLANAVRATENFRGVTGLITFDTQGNRIPESGD